MIPLNSEKALSSTKPDFERIESLSRQLAVIGHYLFTLSARQPRKRKYQEDNGGRQARAVRSLLVVV